METGDRKAKNKTSTNRDRLRHFRPKQLEDYGGGLPMSSSERPTADNDDDYDAHSLKGVSNFGRFWGDADLSFE